MIITTKHIFFIFCRKYDKGLEKKSITKENFDFSCENAADEFNKIEIDLEKFRHEFDPLGIIYNTLSQVELIKNLNVDSRFIINDIIGFNGYTESTLHLPSTSNNFGCSNRDLEQLYFIQTPKISKFVYTLKSFSCYIKCNDNTEYIVTLVLFDKEKVLKNKEKILWQSKKYTLKTTPYQLFDDNSDCHEGHKKNIATFDNINVKLQNNKTYLIRIDIPCGYMHCGRVKDDKLDKNKKYLMVNSSGNYCRNKYYLRDYYPDGKIYKIVFT